MTDSRKPARFARRWLATMLPSLVLLYLNQVSVATAQQPAPPPSMDVFAESIFCGVCHTNSPYAKAMRDQRQREVAPFDLWRSSAMANASRDPYWKAVVSVEVAATPARKAEIEQSCSRCHAPMAGAVPESPEGEVLHYLKQRDQQATLGLDGVSCTVCHQIADKGLGTEATYTGHFQIHEERVAFGPHADPYAMPMRQHAGYLATQGDHILKSALCATCHTLITETLNPDGTATGHQLHEQSAYLEWRNSVYNNEIQDPGAEARSCQDCHVPATDVDGQPIETAIARDPGGQDFPPAKPRTPFGRHTFVGGNTLLAQLLRDNPMELEVFASKNAFDATIEATRFMLENQTATITIGQVQRTGERLLVPVRVQNRTGHKLPTGFPSRRAWVRLEVQDADGQVLFCSGGFDQAGRITDTDGKVLDSEAPSGPVQPHLSRITRSSEVQIYESVMADKDNQVTFTLLRGARYLKDNRLLPRGWKSEHPDAPATAPVGIQGDGFRDGEDNIVYDLPIAADGPLTIHASLLYQSIGVRHVNEVFQFDTPEVAMFKRMYDAADRAPETLGSDIKSVGVSD